MIHNAFPYEEGSLLSFLWDLELGSLETNPINRDCCAYDLLRLYFHEKGGDRSRVKLSKCIILPDPLGALKCELHHLEAWRPSILCSLSFMSVHGEGQ